MANNIRKRVPILVVVVLLAAAGWWVWRAYNTGGTASATAFSGTVDAEEFSVASVIAGRVVRSSAVEGAQVAKGAVLYRLDDAVFRLQIKQAEAGVRATKAAWKQAVDDDDSKADIAAAKARWDQARATLAMTKVQLGYATIRAPRAGVITAVAARAGENAGPGKTLATITDPSTLRVSVYVPETQVGRVKLGDKAKVTADGIDTEFTGKVEFVASEAEFTPNNIETKDQRVKLVYEVRIRIEGSDGMLKPGMPVDVDLATDGGK